MRDILKPVSSTLQVDSWGRRSQTQADPIILGIARMERKESLLCF